MTGVNRREFLEITGATALATLTQSQLEPNGERGFDAYGVLIGPEAARPDRNGEYFREFDTFQFAYHSTDKENKYYTSHRVDGWRRTGCIVQKDGSLYFRKQA